MPMVVPEPLALWLDAGYRARTKAELFGEGLGWTVPLSAVRVKTAPEGPELLWAPSGQDAEGLLAEAADAAQRFHVPPRAGMERRFRDKNRDEQD